MRDCFWIDRDCFGLNLGHHSVHDSRGTIHVSILSSVDMFCFKICNSKVQRFLAAVTEHYNKSRVITKVIPLVISYSVGIICLYFMFYWHFQTITNFSCQETFCRDDKITYCLWSLLDWLRKMCKSIEPKCL